ncbi:helix-turn-helix domain-containing protein [Streptomyces sp. DSM 44915]|uniref:Helix-turn-helix domain-containing protein n=1 Tax=Streptomyces chisholmiae TaxID=3075540 RepID=A0ABU2JZ72_9ACTN|nr:helix-turn-helix domain-containing protein [Streptomyces sp. DSM 44915]MDT0270242.1 helix-turn-helix domain-containing protein [Streptomyces sp. DSM 44915]
MTTPPQFDTALLDRPDLQRALAEHDFAAAFALIRKYGGLSQNKIASACQLTPGKVSTIIRGTHKVTSYDVIARIADGLRIPGHMLGLAQRPWESASAPHPPPTTAAHPAADGPWSPAATRERVARVTRNDLLMDRRTATRSLVGIAMGASLLDDVEEWLTPAPKGDGRRVGRLGTREVEQLEETARVMRQWDRRHGGGLRRRAVLGQLAEVADAAAEHQAEDIARRLYRVMADLAGTAASMAWDSGQQRDAQTYYRLALRSAHAGDDRALGANVLAGMARQMLHDHDRPQDALELVRMAQHGSRNVATPRVSAMLYTREAWCYASAGRVGAFRRAIDQASEALAEASPSIEEPYWIGYFGPSEVAGVAGNRLLTLARREPARFAEEASTAIRTAVEQRGPEGVKSRALDLAGLAECSWLLGDTRSALEQTHQAANAAEATQASQVRAKLMRLYPYTARYSTPEAREARDRLRALPSD